MAAASIEIIDLCDDTPVVAHSPEAEDAALARRLQAEEYGELPPHWAPSEEYGKQQPPSGGGTSTRGSTGGSTSAPAKSKAPTRARSTGGSTGEPAKSKAPKALSKPPYPPATSVYTKSLDAALDAALSAVAADGTPLFTEVERQLLQAHRARAWARAGARVSALLEYTPTLQVTPNPNPNLNLNPEYMPTLQTVRSLEAAPRCLLLRLLLLKDPWHNSALMKYVQEVPSAVAALERAGALLSYQATPTRDQTEELLPCLTVGHELKAVRR